MIGSAAPHTCSHYVFMLWCKDHSCYALFHDMVKVVNPQASIDHSEKAETQKELDHVEAR